MACTRLLAACLVAALLPLEATSRSLKAPTLDVCPLLQGALEGAIQNLVGTSWPSAISLASGFLSDPMPLDDVIASWSTPKNPIGNVNLSVTLYELTGLHDLVNLTVAVDSYTCKNSQLNATVSLNATVGRLTANGTVSGSASLLGSKPAKFSINGSASYTGVVLSLNATLLADLNLADLIKQNAAICGSLNSTSGLSLGYAGVAVDMQTPEEYPTLHDVVDEVASDLLAGAKDQVVGKAKQELNQGLLNVRACVNL